jgi:hypothetical protein
MNKTHKFLLVICVCLTIKTYNYEKGKFQN